MSEGSDRVSFESVVKLCRDCKQEVSEDALGSVWGGITHGQGTIPLSFEEFLSFLTFCETREGLANLPNSPNSAKEQLAESLHTASSEIETPPVPSIRSMLVTHIRTRPDFDDMKSQGILHTSCSENASKLQKQLAKDHLKKHLARRPSMEDLIDHGIALPLSAQQMALERQLIHDHLKHALESTTRPVISELENRGIVRRVLTTATHSFSTSSLLEVERSLNKVRLKHALENPNRPDAEQLQAQGILVDQTPAAHTMERQFAKTQLNRRLSSKPDLKELTAKGIYSTEPHS